MSLNMKQVWRFFTEIRGRFFEIETITDPKDRKQAEDAYKTLFDAYHDGEIGAEDRREIFRSIYELTNIKAREVISLDRLRGIA